MRFVSTMISLLIISAILIVAGYITAIFPKTENFALAFAIYAAIRANQEK